MLSTRMFFWWGQEAETPPVVIPPSTATGLEDPCTEVEELIDLLELHNAENLELSNGDVLELVYSLNWIGSCDDATGEQVQGFVPIGGKREEGFSGADHWVFIDWVRSPGIRVGQVSGGRDLGQRGTLRFTMIKTPDTDFDIPQIGQQVQLSWQDHLQFGGMIENVRMINRAGSHDTVMEIQVDCASWERLAEKRLTNNSYSNTTTAAIFIDLMETYLTEEGVEFGVIDNGLTLSLAGPRQAGDYVRVSEFLRDVAEASGGVYDIDPFRRLNFLKEQAPTGALILRNVVAIQEAQTAVERQEYRNVQTVRCRGTGGNQVEFTREDAEEIAARQAIEGGTGRYEAFETVDHPDSDDDGALGRLAVSMCLVRLNAFGRHSRTLTHRMNMARYRLGDVVTAFLPEHTSGDYQVAGIRFRPVHDQLFADLTLIQTSALQRQFQAWMKIVQASRALVQIPGTPIFTNSLTITSSQVWIVPNANGDGSAVEVEFDVYGPGGGGGGGNVITFLCSNVFGFVDGGRGGNGGKAVSFRTLPVGTVVTITVGARGLAGSNGQWDTTTANPANCGPVATSGSSGAVSSVIVDGITVALANGGSAGAAATDYIGAAGANGTAVGDIPLTGQGAAGGAGGVSGTGPGHGATAFVEVRY